MEGRGRGRAFLGVLREADGIVFCHDASAPLGPLEDVRAEVAAAGIEAPAILAATKVDEAGPDALPELRRAVRDLGVIEVSILHDASLDRFRNAVWELTGLVRVFARRPSSDEADPLAMRPGATVADVAGSVHGELGATCRGARIWGPSVRSPGQFVGRDRRRRRRHRDHRVAR